MTSLRTVADGVRLGRLGPGPAMNLVVLDGGVVVDSGLRLHRRRLTALLRGVDVGTHVVTHAHVDHLGSTAWLCETTGAELAMGHADAALFEGSDIDTVRTRAGRAVSRWLDPPRRAVDRPLRDGDRLGDWQVVEAPGHSPGNVALWREGDGVLVVGDGPVNLGGLERPRWLVLPHALNDDHRVAAASWRRLAELEPRLVVAVHGGPARVDDRWRRVMRGTAPEGRAST